MIRLFLQAYFELLRLDWMMRHGHIQLVHHRVRNSRLGKPARRKTANTEAICHAIDVACILHPRPVLCLQRSAATTVLLKRYGWQAQLVIGAQLLPFKAHAWTEIEGRVINDKPYMSSIYSVLERC